MTARTVATDAAPDKSTTPPVEDLQRRLEAKRRRRHRLRDGTASPGDLIIAGVELLGTGERQRGEQLLRQLLRQEDPGDGFRAA